MADAVCLVAGVENDCRSLLPPGFHARAHRLRTSLTLHDTYLTTREGHSFLYTKDGDHDYSENGRLGRGEEGERLFPPGICKITSKIIRTLGFQDACPSPPPRACRSDEPLPNPASPHGSVRLPPLE